MAMNKSSLRAEFDALKRASSRCALRKMSADSRALFDALLMLCRAVDGGVHGPSTTPKSSANSSLPASQSPNDDTARTRPGAKGKGPSSVSAAPTPAPANTKVLSVDACGRCGEDLTTPPASATSGASSTSCSRRSCVADAQIKHCPRCHAETRACFPHQMPGPLQYGPGIKAYVVRILLIAQMLSLKRVAQSMHALIGRTLSEATLLGYVAQLHHALAEWEATPSSAFAMPAMHVDEPRCAWTGKITGFTSIAPARSP